MTVNALEHQLREETMRDPVRTALWFAALGLYVWAAYALVMWATTPAPEPAKTSGLIPSAVAAEPKAAPAPAQAPAKPTYTMRKTSPGEEFYRMGQYEKAVAFWTDMAAKGDAESHYRLGLEYFHAKSGYLQRDFVKAREHFLSAARLGHPESMFILGGIYEDGYGIKADINEAATWYQRAADYGNAQAQYNYATMLETGAPVPKDEIEAYKYYRLAQAQGFVGVGYDPVAKRASSTLPVPGELLAQRLTAEQKAEGEARIAKFKPLSGPLKV
ncbi:MAG TPA: hypothetical protein DCL54_13045 [Alphaproteobacteria bacterium]|nr:hypothetical protein [Alphaproteobacteria bacterium]HAJ47496.1 hypothetical protein [Alphaproteobacteria bacterium]